MNLFSELGPTAARRVLNGESGSLTIDLGAIERNYHRLRSRGRGRTAAVVKADAYGLGAAHVAERLVAAGCRDFFVAHFAEAERLLPYLSPQATVYALNGLLPGAEMACAQSPVVPVINSLEQLQSWLATSRRVGKRLPAVIQFDTGMSRLGLAPSESPAVAEFLTRDAGIEVLFLMSHLASADEAESTQNVEQLAQMQAIAAEFPGVPYSLANSGGVFLGRDYEGLVARPGIALYGGAPTSGATNPMEPVVSLEVAVLQVRTVPAGTKVGYGGSYRCGALMRLATLAAGYADGLPRSLGDRGAVYVDGFRLPIVGRVSMDTLTVDASALPNGRLTAGSLVEVIGPNQTLEDVAGAADTIAYEVLTRLGQRYRRVYR